MLELAVGGGLALGELLDVAEVEARVREGKPGECFVEIDCQEVAVVVAEEDLDAEAAKSLQIAVEPANVDPELAENLVPGLRPFAEKGQQTVQPGGALAGESDRK